MRVKQKTKTPRQGHRALRTKYYSKNFYTLAVFTVLIILAATLYGSAAEFGRRSSNQPFHYPHHKQRYVLSLQEQMPDRWYHKLLFYLQFSKQYLRS